MPCAGGPSSGYLVASGDTRLLLDCGPGVATAVHTRIDPRALDAVLVSHMHVDHCHDLLPLGKGLVARGGPAHWSGRVALHVPPGAYEVLCAHNRLFPVAPPHDAFESALDRVFDRVFDVREYRPADRFTVGDVTVTTAAMRHRLPCCGFRLAGPGGTLAYSGDTGYTDALVELAHEVDLLLCEATLRIPDETDHGHLSAREAGSIAAVAGARSLVLTHLSAYDAPWLDALVDDARSCYDGPVAIARPGTTVDVGSTLGSRR